MRRNRHAERRRFSIQGVLSEQEMERARKLVVVAVGIAAVSSPTAMIGIITLSMLLAVPSGLGKDRIEDVIWYLARKGVLVRRGMLVGLRKRNGVQAGQAPLLCGQESKAKLVNAA